MLCKSGYSTVISSSGHQNIAITGLCFEPKALIVYVHEASLGSFSNGGGFRPPEATFSNSWSDELSTEWGYRSRWDSGNVRFSVGAGASLAAGTLDATVVSYDADGFTLHFPSFGTFTFMWMAIGGDNVQTFAGDFTVNAGSTSSIAETGVGFQPDFLLCTALYDSGVSNAVSHGMASSSSDQAATASSMGVGTSSKHTLLDGYLVCPWETNFADVKYLAQLSSFDSDGFTVAVPSNTGSQNTSVNYLAVKDPDSQFMVGVETQKTSTGTKATTGVGFQPNGGIFLGSYKTVTNDTTQVASPGSDAMLSIGTADGILNQSCEVEFNISGGFGGHDQNTYADTDIVLALGNNAATLITEASVDSWDSDGFTLDWTVSDGTARYFIYGVFETLYPDPCSPPSTGFVPQIYRRLEAG